MSAEIMLAACGLTRDEAERLAEKYRKKEDWELPRPRDWYGFAQNCSMVRGSCVSECIQYEGGHCE